MRIQEDTEMQRRATHETIDSDLFRDRYQYQEFKEPEPQLEDIGEEGEEGVTPEVGQGRRDSLQR